MNTINIDKEKCIHCGLCISDCVSKCISFDDEKFPKTMKAAAFNASTVLQSARPEHFRLTAGILKTASL